MHGDLAQIIAKATAKDPNDRYANAGELASVLGEMCGVTAEPAQITNLAAPEDTERAIIETTVPVELSRFTIE